MRRSEEVELAEVVQEVAVLLLHLVALHLGNNADSGKATPLDPSGFFVL